MNALIKKSNLAIIMLALGIMGCKSNQVNIDYNPNEFTLLIAASNNGEVGPCG